MLAHMKTALTIVGNLLFRSKLEVMLSAAGLTQRSLRGGEDPAEVVREFEPALVILDLAHTGLDPLGALRALRSPEVGYSGPILCYGPHVEAELFEQARQLGASEVVANSAMSAHGGRLIAELIAGR